MRAFLTACLVIIAIGTGGYFSLNVLQKPSGFAFSTEAARIDPQMVWRSVYREARRDGRATETAVNFADGPSEFAEACEARASWQWIFVDLGTPDGEPATCSYSQ